MINILKKSNDYSIFKIEEQWIVEITSKANQEIFVFKIEILVDIKSGIFSGRIYRKDLFRLKYFSEAKSCEVADHEIWVVDDFISGQNFKNKSIDELKKEIIKFIEDIFNRAGCDN